jgi:hypothetical protein
MTNANVHRWVAGIAAYVLVWAAHAAPLPLFDAHVHYSEDAWSVVSPKEAIARLRAAGVMRALVSSSNDDGTQKLYAEAPDLVIPELRPYRTRADQSGWVHDESIIAHVEARLKEYQYVAIGELHVSGAEADSPVMRRVVELARQHGLMLHVHSDADTLERIYRQDPQARILWAHAGFEDPVRVRAMLHRYPSLWVDLSFRAEVAVDGRVVPAWRETFLEFPDRFMVGTDTYIPERWSKVGAHASWARQWLADLPPQVAERIAYRNGETVLTAAFQPAGAPGGGSR